MAARIVPNKRGIEQALRQEGVRAELRARAEGIADRARAIAPVRTGRYRASIHVEEFGTNDFRVVAGVDYAVYVEAADHTLGDALDSAAVRAQRP